MTEKAKRKAPLDCDAGHSTTHRGLESHKGMGCSKQDAFHDLKSNIWVAILESRSQAGEECSQHPCSRGGDCRTKLTKDDGTGDDLDLDSISVKYVTVEIDDCPNRLGWECTADGTLSIRSMCYCQ